jgi:hypothetical protein
MNTNLLTNYFSVLPFFPAVQSKPNDLPKIPWWLRLIACFYIYREDPAALHYVQSKYEGIWD